MNEERLLSVQFTQFLLRSVAQDLEATKEVLGPGSPLSGAAARDASAILKSIADGLERAVVVNNPLISSADSESQTGLRAAAGIHFVICAEWPL